VFIKNNYGSKSASREPHYSTAQKVVPDKQKYPSFALDISDLLVIITMYNS
jgi:hypothetical protein